MTRFADLFLIFCFGFFVIQWKWKIHLASFCVKKIMPMFSNRVYNDLVSYMFIHTTYVWSASLAWRTLAFLYISAVWTFKSPIFIRIKLKLTCIQTCSVNCDWAVLYSVTAVYCAPVRDYWNCYHCGLVNTNQNVQASVGCFSHSYSQSYSQPE